MSIRDRAPAAPEGPRWPALSTLAASPGGP